MGDVVMVNRAIALTKAINEGWHMLLWRDEERDHLSRVVYEEGYYGEPPYDHEPIEMIADLLPYPMPKPFSDYEVALKHLEGMRGNK